MFALSPLCSQLAGDCLFTQNSKVCAEVEWRNVLDRNHPDGESVLQDIKQHDLLSNVMKRQADGDELIVCTPIKKARLATEISAREVASAPAAAEVVDSDNEFAELSEMEAADDAADAEGYAKRVRKPTERFDASARDGSRARKPPAPKISAPANSQKKAQAGSQKRGPRGKDENGNPVRMKYTRRINCGAPAALDEENDGE